MSKFTTYERLRFYSLAYNALSGRDKWQFICTALQYFIQMDKNERVLLKDIESHFPELAAHLPIGVDGIDVRLPVLYSCINSCKAQLGM